MQMKIKTLAGLILSLVFLSVPSYAQDIYGPPPSSVGIALPGQVPATQTNDSACSTCVGYTVSSSVVAGSAVSVTDVVAKTVTSVSIPAGDWLAAGCVYGVGSGATVNQLIGTIGTTTDTLDTTPGRFFQAPYGTGISTGSSSFGFCIAPSRISLSATTTYYLVGRVGFSAGTMKVFGSITFTRIR